MSSTFENNKKEFNWGFDDFFSVATSRLLTAQPKVIKALKGVKNSVTLGLVNGGLNVISF